MTYARLSGRTPVSGFPSGSPSSASSSRRSSSALEELVQACVGHLDGRSAAPLLELRLLVVCEQRQRREAAVRVVGDAVEQPRELVEQAARARRLEEVAVVLERHVQAVVARLAGQAEVVLR